MPVRQIPKNYRSLTGMVANIRTQSLSAFESSLERDFLLLLDFDPDVETFEVQPVRIEYRDGHGRHHRYTPDVLVRYRAGESAGQARMPLLGEIKYRDDLRQHWIEYKSKFKAAKRFARAHGWMFRLITERDIRTPYLTNARFLRAYRTLPTDQALCLQLSSCLNDHAEMTPKKLLTALFTDCWQQAQALPMLWQLVAVRRIEAELSQPLTMNSRLWAPRLASGKRP